MVPAIGLRARDGGRGASLSQRVVRIRLTPLGERARRRRGLDEHAALRFPALYRRIAAALMPLAPGSRLRRLILVRRVRQAYAEVNRRDFELVLVGWNHECEYRPSADLLPPDAEPIFHGHDGMRQLWRYWLEAFSDIRWEPEEILDLGDRFLVTARQSGTGSGSGVAVSEPVFQLFTLRDGLVLRQEDFRDRTKALEAAGVAVE
jgi:ketosteroid isomerase-like protein